MHVVELWVDIRPQLSIIVRFVADRGLYMRGPHLEAHTIFMCLGPNIARIIVTGKKVGECKRIGFQIGVGTKFGSGFVDFVVCRKRNGPQFWKLTTPSQCLLIYFSEFVSNNNLNVQLMNGGPLNSPPYWLKLQDDINISFFDPTPRKRRNCSWHGNAGFNYFCLG